MNEEPVKAEETDEQGRFEDRLRDLLTEDAYAIHPSPAPYPAIRRRGAIERRRRLAVAGAALATLAVVPVGAYAVAGGNGGNGGRGADTAAAASPRPSVSAPQSPAAAAPTTPPGPQHPAMPGQLLDGITFEQATDGLEKCIAFDKDRPEPEGWSRLDLGKAADYRIILAMRATGDSNTPGDGYFVVAVREQPQQIRLICTIKDDEAAGLNTSGGGADADMELPPVVADINSGKLYQQSFLDRGNWKLPFRWGIIGTVEPSVAKVTVSYGDSSATAVLDHGWFVAAGILNEQVTLAPHIKGYDSSGKLVYDSDKDKLYEKTLP
ncbi:hypothetical protein [Streptomyces sp. NPDC018693]|uniref:hypothetical protein n=1 Tax=unclassified Streptomyces TaxID=2593676 RepID=UPI00379BAB9B